MIDYRAVIRVLPIAAALLVGCVQINDERDAGQPLPPSGQVDTGPVAQDADDPPELPRQACNVAADCAEWLPSPQCATAACSAGRCEAIALEDGTPCTDNDFRTRGDTCTAGLCAPGDHVCVCKTDGDCTPFDDGNQCNGRLTCDGCACVAVDTPPGSPCDDQNPATIDDSCVDDQVCAGSVPCQCEVADDCAIQQCRVATCDQCQCRIYPAVAGLLYDNTEFAGEIPESWTTEATNPAVRWRPDPGGGLRATGPDGTYDHGAAVATLTSTAFVLPPGGAILRLEVGLFSAESGCDDRLTLHLGAVLLDSICGPSALATRDYVLPLDQPGQLRVTFTSDADDNASAGAFLGPVQWIRTEPDECAPPAEMVVPSAPAGLQTSPAIAQAPNGGWQVVWRSHQGIVVRALNATGTPTGEDSVVDAFGDNPVASGTWQAWERVTDRRVVVARVGQDPVVLGDEEPIFAPDLAGEEPVLAYLAEVDGGTVVRLRTGVASPPTIVGMPLDYSFGPRVALTDTGPALLMATPSGLTLHRGPLAELVAVAAPTSRPTLAFGHERLVSAWTRSDGLVVRREAFELNLEATEPASPSLVPIATGWVLAWTVAGKNDTGVAAALLTVDATLATTLKGVAEYTFDDQDGIRLAPFGDDVLAVWRSDWFDGDPSGIVVRRLTPTLSN